MFKNKLNEIKNIGTEEIIHTYYVPYITRKGFIYILKVILKYAKNNNMIPFTKKYINENLLIN